MSEVIEFQGLRFLVQRRPRFITRMQARLALRAYEKTKGPFLWFEAEFDKLEALREAASRRWMLLHRQGPDADEWAIADAEREMERINKRFEELGEPSLKAQAAFSRAKRSMERVLAKVGFEPVDDDLVEEV
ncbi:hypothetical protein P9A16_26855 [Shinella sp. 838]|uniref:hypothetical protein n=1 Tax=Shinella sp. 838 TaxID=3038164 RepID=UPI002414D815|nr:hypothetical protein [Shinella sp. 838]MDG4674750.1 hypothetical protein [Shinella sp. 838]